MPEKQLGPSDLGMADRLQARHGLLDQPARLSQVAPRALDEAAAGNMAGATQKLRSAATRLLDLGELELAQTMQRAADTMESGSGPTAADQKQITYATRRLTLSELTGENK